MRILIDDVIFNLFPKFKTELNEARIESILAAYELL